MTLAIGLVAVMGCEGVEQQAPVVVYPAPAVTKIEVSTPASRPPSDPGATVAVDGIVVTTARKLERPTEVVGIIDEHEPSGRQDAAFTLLRRRAAAMGADAVVGVEFHHGEEGGGPTHLSGLAVRYLDHLRAGEWP